MLKLSAALLSVVLCTVASVSVSAAEEGAASVLPHSEPTGPAPQAAPQAPGIRLYNGDMSIARLQPYKAVYVLSLGQKAEGGRLAAVEGRFTSELTMTCAGNATSTRMMMTGTEADGKKFIVTTESGGWESRDGLSFRYNSVMRENGVVRSSLSGVAKFETLGGAGTATLQSGPDDKKEVVIPAGAMFPLEFNLSLVRAAARGVAQTSATVFDGQDFESGLAKIEMDILAPRPTESAVVHAAHIEPDKVWPVQVRDMRVLANGTSHARWGGLSILPNGIIESMQRDFGGATVQMALERLEMKDAPACN